jgi:hypothetical protein
MGSEPGLDPDLEDLHEFDVMEQITRRVGRAMAIGFPVWVLLLFLFPFSGMGALACMSGASLLTLGVVIWADRRHARRGGGGAPAGAPTAGAPRAPMSPLTAAGLTLGGVVLLVYVVFVIVTALRGA